MTAAANWESPAAEGCSGLGFQGCRVLRLGLLKGGNRMHSMSWDPENIRGIWFDSKTRVSVMVGLRNIFGHLAANVWAGNWDQDTSILN